ncbi:MAG: diguanylate cyclase [Rhodospirillales bacterium]|nr:diguanylate cyclase [Rhodospirillales bacterium]
MSKVSRLIFVRRLANSMATRAMVMGLVVVLAGAGLRYHLIGNFLREDLEVVVSAQLEALAGYVARDIDSKIVERQRFLGRLAASLPLALLKRPEALRTWLGEHHDIHPLFALGLVVGDPEGRAIADYPPVAGRMGSNYADRDYAQAALAGEPAIGRPIIGRNSGVPVLPMAAPVKDSSGTVVAVVAGVAALAAPGFLDLLQERRIGETGGFLVISPKDQIFVAATKKDLVFKPTAAPGVNSLHDRALAGWRGVGVTVNAQGVEEVVAVASVPSTGWFVVARLPTAEAFATVGRTQEFILRHLTTAVVTFVILFGGIMFIMFRPLFRAANHADRMTLGQAPLEPLAVMRSDEVGHLTAAFNRLLAKLKDSQDALARVAHHDALTGLPNRLLLSDRMSQALARAQRHQSRLALLFFDLDGFKPINDSLGHEAGDQTLVEVARRLGTVIRETDTLARVGGDEFVVVMGDLGPTEADAEAAAAVVAQKCVEAVRMPMTVKGEGRSLGLSVGIALGDGASSVDDLLSRADRAMYEAKQSGGGRYVLGRG